jgi:hypothetical protein
MKDLISNRKLIVPNELHSLESGRRTDFDKLKSRITDDQYVVRNLFQDAVKVRNVNNYIFCSNNEDSIRLGACDRRYFVLAVSDVYMQNERYFELLFESFTPEMKTHLLNFYLRLDTHGFNPRTPPETELKRELQESQLPYAEQWVKKFKFPEEGCYTLDEMWVRFQDWLDKMGIDRKYGGKPGAAFGKRIAKYCSQQGRKDGQRTYSAKIEASGATTTPEERKALMAEQLAQKEALARVNDEIKRRLE